ncbi:MAG: DUF5060 domain-containing protein [Opitutaceae bacterium]|nr:DUF5060 domain-containing protein [Opitutaceae bacterium]
MAHPGIALARIVLLAAVLPPSLLADTSVVALGEFAPWRRAEWRVDGVPVVDNPFDPDQIRVDATVTAPSGRAMTVPAFWHREYSRALVDGKEVLTPAAEPQWRLRFTPTESGEHALVLSTALRGGPAVASPAVRFAVAGPAADGQHGWVRVAADRRSLETSDGRVLRLLGANVCWGGDRGTYSYDAWLPAMRDAGENFARLWFAPWSMGIEHAPGTLNRYDLAAAWQADHAVQLAEACGIYVLIALDHHGMFMANDPAWGGSNNFWTRSSPYAAENGGPCASPNAFFTSPEARTLYQKRLRYLIARYGSSPHLLSWQFFNEIDNAYIPRSDLVASDVATWHRDMGRWLRANDPYRHLVSTSLTGASDRPEISGRSEMDFSVYHSYGEADPALYVAGISARLARAYDKPVMIGEIGTNHLGWQIHNDPHLRGFRQGLWGGVLGGSVGSSMSWWWEDLHDDRVYPHYTVAREVMARAGWGEGVWKPAEFVTSGEPPLALGEPAAGAQPFSATLPLNQLRLNPVSGETAIADPLAASRTAERLSTYLHGSRSPHLQQHARMHAWFAERARLIFRVNSVACDADLIVRVDGEERLRAPLVNKDGLATLNDEINQEYTVDVPAGRHSVEIAHTGADWVNLKSIRLERMLPAPFAGGWTFAAGAIGLRRGDDAAVVYVRSPHVAWPAGATRYNPPVVSDAVVTLAGWTGGTAAVIWVDPASGRDVIATRAEPRGGDLPLAVPEFTDDLVAIVRAQAAR